MLRTRFERHMFGLTASVVEARLGQPLQSLEKEYLEEILRRPGVEWTELETRLVSSVAHVFRRFTYLCDASNWSDDGQDPRVDLCRRGILAICDLAEVASRGRHESRRRSANRGAAEGSEDSLE